MDVKDVTVVQEDLDKVREETNAHRVLFLTHQELYLVRAMFENSLGKVPNPEWEALRIKLYNA